ncbi:MAG: hypothetical protein AAF429_04005 [Pseudomonadota bacterium]
MSARHGKLACVLFYDGKLMEYHQSRLGIRSVANARKCMQRWLELYSPSVVIAEDFRTAKSKGKKQREIIKEIKKTARLHGVKTVSIRRRTEFGKTFKRNDSLAKRFPRVAHLNPKRPKLWEAEPKEMSLFEALSIAVSAKADRV